MAFALQIAQVVHLAEMLPHTVHHQGSELIPDIIVGLLALCLVVLCLYKRPKITGALLGVWLAWLLCKFLQGATAWSHVVTRIQQTSEATIKAFIACWKALCAWLFLLFPFLDDVFHFVKPLVVAASTQIVRGWNAMSWEERGIAAVGCMGVCSTVWIASVMWRSREKCWQKIRRVVFHLSFFVVGPAVWWISVRWLASNADVPTGVFMSLLPTLASVDVLLTLWRERELAKQQQANQKSWRSWFNLGVATKEQTFLQSRDGFDATRFHTRLRSWLSYWSCWPLLYFLEFLIHDSGLVDEEDYPSAYGVLTALALWAQWWEASRLAPYLYVIVANCFGGCFARLSAQSSAVKTEATGCVYKAWRKIMNQVGNHYVAVGVVLFAAAAVVAFFLKVLSLISSLVAFMFLVSVAGDSARWVARDDPEMCPARLSFWVIAMVWLSLCEIPLLRVALSIWTPVVFVVALVAGETCLMYVAYGSLRWIQRCLDRCVASHEAKKKEAKNKAMEDKNNSTEEPLLADTEKEPLADTEKEPRADANAPPLEK